VLDEPYFAVLRQRIREARMRLQISQENAAELTGVPLRSYQTLEARGSSRRFNPTIATLRAVARALQIEIGALTREASPAEIKRLAVDTPQKRVPQKKRGTRFK
jgi:transcriptional regulator with XRE-family HTH domain